MSAYIYRRILLMVGDLHGRGYERLRISPSMSPSGMAWRCSITPASNISASNGATLVDWDCLAAHYTSGVGADYFGWDDAADLTPVEMATLFIARFPEIVASAKGEDPAYAHWYQEMLRMTDPDLLPIAYADWDAPEDGLETVCYGDDGRRRDIVVPSPPPGEGIGV